MDRTRPSLTESEAAVLVLLAQGLTEKEAGFRLGIDRWAVAGRMRDARRRFGAQTTLHLYALVQQQEAA